MQLKDKTLQNLHVAYGNLKMKINEILVEAPIDQLIPPATAPATAQPGQQRNANGQYASQQPASPLSRLGTGIATGISNTANALTKTIEPHTGTSYFVQPKATVAQQKVAQQAGATQPAAVAPTKPGAVAPQTAKDMQTAAKNKVTSQGTGTPEIDAMLRSAGVLKP
jgi:hypothetical protein